MSLEDQICTLTEDYLDSADYSVDGDCAKARTFEATLRKLMVLPKSAFHASESLTFAPETWLELLRDVQSWIGSNCPAVTSPTTVTESAGGGAVALDLRRFRE